MVPPVRLAQGVLSGGIELKPELMVELSVTTPDGRRFIYTEGAECEEGHVPVNAEIADMIDAVYGAALTRFGVSPA